MLARGRPLALFLGLAGLAFAGAGCQPKPSDIPGPEQPWKDMSHDERQVYMAQAVLPHMQASFREFDAERFADFDCATCHVTGAAAGTFAMPDPGIPKLSRSKFRQEHMKKHPETVRFMWETVEPEMSALLGGPKGLRGFNCRDCHMIR
ncbi:hypothetical protein ACNOYE_08915 [Nannocystaceae bacterium ST9]